MMGLYQSSGEKAYLHKCAEPGGGNGNSDDIRLIVKIAQLYYEQDMSRRKLRANWVFTAPPSAACLTRPRSGNCHHRHQL